jgi:hypothetical protein
MKSKIPKQDQPKSSGKRKPIPELEAVLAGSPTAATNPTPKIHKATLGTGGDVIRGARISEDEAILERKAGRDVVVCGKHLMDNRDLAERVEQMANGSCKSCPWHPSSGPGALPHFQPDPRPPDGHSFYETVKRKAKKKKKP